MDTFRKWWNKPKADDKSILARFYYADKALTAVASELDSFDGRAEPERCSRLVGRLRQGQDQVLAITNIIMDELLGEDRAPRAFRAKFPEEVLQESLAGQLWFGAECLAAGSSIMNREAESSQMRPLAKAVTKSLDHVRNLLREQCLRNKTPNSLTLNLDLNDAVTETLCESLKIFDRLFAEFEFLYVSAMVQVKSKHEHEMQELICVLFSETLQRALRIGLLEQEQVDYYDPSLMFSIPRLAIVAGLVIYNKGPLNMSMPADQLSEMFRPFRTLLIKIRDLLRTLNTNELYQLEKLLCTNEDIHIYSPTADDTKASPNPNLNQIQNENSMPNVNVNVNTNTVTNDNVSTAAISNFNCDVSDDDEEEKFAESNSSSSSSSSSNSSASSSGSESTASTVSRSSSIQSSTQSSNTMEIPSETNSETDLDRNVINCTVTEIERNFSNRTNINNNNNNNIIHNNINMNINRNDNINNNDNNMPPNSNNLIASTISNDVWMNAPITFSDESMVAATSTTLLMDSDIEPESSTHRNKNDWINTDCASGYLIPNTNFGNLLQTTDTPLTDSFISSDDEYTQKSEKNFEINDDINGDDSNNIYVIDSTSENNFETVNDIDPNLTAIQTMMDSVRMHVNEPNRIQTVTSISGAEGSINRIGIKRSNNVSDSGIGTAENTSLEHTPESEENKLVVSTQSCDVTVTMPNHNIRMLSEPNDVDLYRNTTSTTELYSQNSHCQNYPTSSYFPADRTERHNDIPIEFSSSQISRPHGKSSRHHSHSHSHSNSHGRREKCERTGCTKKHSSNNSNVSRRRSYKRSSRDIEERVSISSTSCIYSEGDPQDIWRSSGRIKFKSTENLLHRLFVCIAGVADQLQTNFASDLRQILRSVFLMNISPSLEESDISIDDKSKDLTSDLFEFRASENDVIQDNNGGSNQSIYSAEEANPETDSVFEQSMNQTTLASPANDRQERSASLETEIRITTNRVNCDRRQSLGDEINAQPVSLVVTTTNQIQCMENNGNNCEHQSTMYGNDLVQPSSRISRNINSNNNNNINNNNSISNHQIDTQTLSSTTTTTIILTTNNRMNRNSTTEDESPRQSSQQQQQQHQQRNTYQNSQQDLQTQHQIMTETPPRWIPDEEAAQCMSCSQTFTTFRRRHHCRCCGGVFCGICSNSQAPLPKFGLNKAVRVCRNCFTLQLSNVAGNGTHM